MKLMATIGDQSLFVRGGTKYAWNNWCDGQVWILERGKDFPDGLNVQHLQNMVYTNGRLRGGRMKTRKVDADHLALQFIPGQPSRSRS